MILPFTAKPNGFQSYAHIADVMLRASTMCTGTFLAGSAEKSSKIAARELAMEYETESDPELIDVANHMLRAAMGLQRCIDDSDDGTDVSGWINARESLLRWSEMLCPPRPCWPANVIPFVPRRVG